MKILIPLLFICITACAKQKELEVVRIATPTQASPNSLSVQKTEIKPLIYYKFSSIKKLEQVEALSAIAAQGESIQARIMQNRQIVEN